MEAWSNDTSVRIKLIHQSMAINFTLVKKENSKINEEGE